MRAYQNPLILPRAKGQRLDKPLLYRTALERFSIPRGSNRFGTPDGSVCKVVGSFEGRSPFGQSETFEMIEVTLINGTIVPAFSKGGDYMVCQDYNFKAHICK